MHKSVKSWRLQLTRSELIEHWLNFALLSIPIFLIGYATFDEAIERNAFPYPILILLIIFLLIFRSKWYSTNMDEYQTNLTKADFVKANDAAAKLNGWVVLRSHGNQFTALQHAAWQHDGIRITAIWKKGAVFLNSMVSPSLVSNPLTFGFVRKNKLELIKQYQSILVGNDLSMIVDQTLKAKDNKFWNESEFSGKNLAMKLIAYPLGIAFAGFGFGLLLQGEMIGMMWGVITIGMVAPYFYYDIKIIIQKRRRARKSPGENSKQQ